MTPGHHYRISELLDMSLVDRLAGSNYRASGMPIGIVDAYDGSVIIGHGWQDICVKFHRANSASAALCLESDLFITSHLRPGEALPYKCLNGLWDIGIPIIVEGNHLASLFLGQFFYEDEMPDREFFCSQADKFGYDRPAYLSALDRVPIFSKEKVNNIIEYNQALALFLGGLAEKSLQSMRIDKELRESRERYRELLETIQLAAIMLDPSGNIAFCNDYLLALTGWIREEVIGRNWFDLFIPDELREPVMNIFGAAISKAEMTSHFENPIKTRDGKLRLIVWDNTTLLNPEGSVAGIASIGVDVTEQRNLEEQLRHAQKLEAIGALAGGVAHDFNNILSAIVGYAHLTLTALPEGDQLRGNMEEILRASDRATVLTQGLLAFSRKQVIKPAPVDLCEIVARQERLLSRLIREDISISTTCSGAPLMIMADRGQVEQIIMNLVTNARDAMPRGGLISIKAERGAIDKDFEKSRECGKVGEYALLSVSDTGEGMNSETRERIFEPFFTTKEQGNGTGLGLAIVYGIVKQHSGHIVVQADPGAGATFSIYLPLIDHPHSEAPVKIEPPVETGGSETILLAEDDPALRKLNSTVLRHYGYQVIEAVDGQDAVMKFAENRQDIALVILDGIMPRMNGKEACQEIRRLAPGIKTIFLSGYAEDVISKGGFVEPDINFVLKPITPKTLLKIVKEALLKK